MIKGWLFAVLSGKISFAADNLIREGVLKFCRAPRFSNGHDGQGLHWRLIRPGTRERQLFYRTICGWLQIQRTATGDGDTLALDACRILGI